MNGEKIDGMLLLAISELSQYRQITAIYEATNTYVYGVLAKPTTESDLKKINWWLSDLGFYLTLLKGEYGENEFKLTPINS